MNKRAIRKFFSSINLTNLVFTMLGSAMVALGTSIHVDSGAADGGVIGIARIIEHFTDGRVEIWLSSLIINIFCYILAWRLMDSKFIVNMAVGTACYSLFVKLFEPIDLDLHDYTLLATFLGMRAIEVGTGLMLRYGSSPNGEHVLSMAIVKKGGFDFGWVHFIKDAVIIVLFFPILGDIKPIIYSLILMTLTTPIVDIIVTAPKKSSIRKRASEKKNSWIPILIAGLIMVIIFSAVAIFINNYYKADTDGAPVYDTVEVIEHDDMTVYAPTGEIKAGFVFYPGGRVEYTAYAPLLEACANNGILCIAVKMPANLAFFGMNKGIRAMELYPDIENWYIGGHSLGGSMAASCTSLHDDAFDGVILLASYSTVDISDLPVLSVYGSLDGVMNMNNYNKHEEKISRNLTKYVIEGGNHAYFGMYGEQKGDGEAKITNIEQITITASYIKNFILE
jgi:uncharacterized membrane-anchored protein YitT (DUF2179 family)